MGGARTCAACLIRSIAAIPLGGFLVWTTQPDPETVRGGAGSPGTAVKLLLDGQQRATSLYGVMRGRPPEFFQGNVRAFTDLYFNVRSETFEFYGPVKMARRPPLWLSVTDLFQSELAAVIRKVPHHTDGYEDMLQRLMMLRGIGDMELHIEEIAGDGHNHRRSGGDLQSGQLRRDQAVLCGSCARPPVCTLAPGS